MGVVTVEEVAGKAALRRFRELPFALHRDDPRWAPPVLAFEHWRLDPHRNPFFELGDAAYFLARDGGRPAGRITAHVAEPDSTDGWFGFFDVTEDPAVAAALLDAAQEWLVGRGCTSMTGPCSFTAGIEAGVLVDGFDVPGVTGRPWHPQWYAAALEAWGLEPAGDVPTWRLPATPDPSAPRLALGGDPPPHAGSYADPRLVLTGDGVAVAAVPDLAEALRMAGLRSAWRLARRARERAWDGCTIVRLDGDAAVAVPALVAAAADAGYRWVVSPWAPDGRRPEAVHRTWRASMARRRRTSASTR